jgi:Nif-specific regulatory protein
MSPESFGKVSETIADQAVYIILRDDLKWRNVFRLTPGQVTTIGRAPTNRIVIPDDICSRHHCEIFQSSGKWVLRDLESRNGTLIEGDKVTKDRQLDEGEQIQIGDFYLVFTHDISKPLDGEQAPLDDNTETYDSSNKTVDQPEIIYRRHQSRYHSGGGSEDIGRDRTSQELAKLYRLALDMGSATDAKALADLVLECLFTSIKADIGAILMLPKNISEPTPAQLRISAYRTLGDETYQKVSNSLSGMVLSEWEGILARDIKEDSRLSETGSLEKLQAVSVICAPIRTKEKIYGVVHLYSTHGKRTLELEDLEYTLAASDQFALSLENLTQRDSLEDGLARAKDEAEVLRTQLQVESDLIGDSPAIQNLNDTIGRLAPTDATVLIRGESGVGKELVARALHFGSDRRNAPYVCMNCAALSETLLESELFGHEKGAFTGAVNRKLGKFEQADQGTLFLDEVGEMSLAIQAKFLRVLEGHPFERVGGGSQIQVDVRVVAATNRDLEKAIEEKSFRQDLFFRLFVVEIAVPPLRDYSMDVPVLANHFLLRLASRKGRHVRGFSQEAMDVLVAYDWPGNVRELQNIVERSVILSPHEMIQPQDIQLSTLAATEAHIGPSHPAAPATQNRDISLERLERDHILATLERTKWNKSLAAQILGIERSTLDRKLKRYDVKRPAKN